MIIQNQNMQILRQNSEKLERDYAEVVQKMTEKRREMRRQKNKYDPLNDTAVTDFSGNQNEQLKFDQGNDNVELEDEQLRQVLDSIDIKIGYAIEEKE